MNDNFYRQAEAAERTRALMHSKHHEKCSFVHDEYICDPDCTVLKEHIAAAALAQEIFGDDELEEYADEKRRKAKAAMRKVPVEGEH